VNADPERQDPEHRVQRPERRRTAVRESCLDRYDNEQAKAHQLQPSFKSRDERHEDKRDREHHEDGAEHYVGAEVVVERVLRQRRTSRCPDALGLEHTDAGEEELDDRTKHKYRRKPTEQLARTTSGAGGRITRLRDHRENYHRANREPRVLHGDGRHEQIAHMGRGWDVRRQRPIGR